ncbi:virulence RhuM family protein [Enterococcus cecorum]|nr:virulence RhuM family protein [Enterococcus cecorum]CAI3514235.1 virulence RhuM family protein [Enterococcus cecorum]
MIDGYIDVITLNILAKKNVGIDVFAYTLPSTRISAQDINSFDAQYPTLTVKRTTAFHDRFLIIDGVHGYHIGSSLKDVGKKCFVINKIESVDVLKDIMSKAQQTGV